MFVKWINKFFNLSQVGQAVAWNDFDPPGSELWPRGLPLHNPPTYASANKNPITSEL